MPSHGGNTGSNPVGDASNNNILQTRTIDRPTNLPQRRRWTVPDADAPQVEYGPRSFAYSRDRPQRLGRGAGFGIKSLSDGRQRGADDEVS
jgi:hypothetical protein